MLDRSASLLLASLALLATPSLAGAATLEIAVSGVRNGQGRVHVDICPEAAFLKDCPWSGEAAARAGTTIVTVDGLPPGRYAAQAFHDENGNRDVDRALFGIPKEGIGFSNDARIRMAPPKFHEAAFDLADGNRAHRISFRLRYFLR